MSPTRPQLLKLPLPSNSTEWKAMPFKIYLFDIGYHHIYMSWNSWSSCLCLLNARITGVYCYTQLETSPLTHRPLGIQTKVAILEVTNTLEFHWILKTKTSQKQQTIKKAKQSTGTHTPRASCCVASTLPSGLLSYPSTSISHGTQHTCERGS